jgi:hypothetical protein
VLYLLLSSFVSLLKKTCVKHIGLSKGAAVVEVGPWFAGASRAFTLAPSNIRFTGALRRYLSTLLSCAVEPSILRIYLHQKARVIMLSTHFSHK